jgi:hypothetical protein
MVLGLGVKLSAAAWITPPLMPSWNGSRQKFGDGTKSLEVSPTQHSNRLLFAVMNLPIGRGDAVLRASFSNQL